MSIIDDIKEGLTLVQIAKKYKVSKSAVSQFLKPYKVAGAIKKIGYGVWEIDYFKLDQVNKAHRVDMPSKMDVQNLTSDKIRGHGFVFNIKLPNIPRWEERETYLIKKKVKYKNIPQGQSILIKNHKVWLSDKSITVYFPSNLSYFTDSSKEAKNYAVYDLLQIIRRLERMLKVSLEINKQYKFKVSRQHYSMIKNVLAQQYDKEGKKLHVYTSEGLWLLIDNSFNLHELETVHPKTAEIDMNPIKNHFNDLKTKPSYLPSEAKTLLDGFAANIDKYNKNIELHLEVLQDMRDTLKKISKKFDEQEDIDYFKL